MCSWYHAMCRNMHVSLVPHKSRVHDDVILHSKNDVIALLHKSIVIFLTMELFYTEKNSSCSYQRTSANRICAVNKAIQYVYYIRLGHAKQIYCSVLYETCCLECHYCLPNHNTPTFKIAECVWHLLVNNDCPSACKSSKWPL